MAATGELKERIQLLQAAVARGQATGKTLKPELQAELDSYRQQGLLGKSDGGGTAASDPEQQSAIRAEAVDKIRLATSLKDRSANGWFTTGIGAKTAGSIGGTGAYDLAQDTETLKNAGALQRVMQLSRDNGGKNPLTPLSNSDFQALASSLSNLDTGQSDEQYQRNVDRVIELYKRAYQGAGGADLEAELAGNAPRQDAASAGPGAATGPGGVPNPFDGGAPPPQNRDAGGSVQFADEGPQMQAEAVRLSDEQFAQLQRVAQTGANTDTLAGVVLGFGRPVDAESRKNLEGIAAFYAKPENRGTPLAVDYRRDEVRPVDPGSLPQNKIEAGDLLNPFTLPSKLTAQDGAVGAAIRGAGNVVTATFGDELGALGDTVLDGGDYSDNLDRRRGYELYDEQEHPYGRILGQVFGSAVLPTSALAASRAAGIAAIRSGMTAAEARQVANLAFARRTAMEAGAFGGVAGFGNSQGGFGERFAAGLAGAGIGAVSGGALGYGGATAAGALRARRVASMRAAPSMGDAQAFGEAAARRGVDYLPADVPGATTARMASGVANISLGAIPLSEAAGRAVASADRAKGAVARGIGTIGDTTQAGQAVQRGANSFIERTQGRGQSLYEAIPISGRTNSSVTNTRSTLADLTAGLESNPELSRLVDDPRLKAYEAAFAGRSEQVPTGLLDGSGNPITRTVQRGGELSWQDLKSFRTYVGEKLGGPQLQSDTSRNALKALYSSLSADMEATAAAQGPKALNAFKRANSYWRARQTRIENVLSDVLGDDLNKSPDAAFRRIEALAAKRSGEPIKLARLVRSLPDEEANMVRATVLDRLGLANPGRQNTTQQVYSPAEFMTQWSKLSDRAKAVLFVGEHRQAVDDLVRIADGMKGSSQFANTSRTSLGTNALAVLATFWVNPLLPLVSAGGQLSAGKLLASQRFAKWLARAPKKPNLAAQKAHVRQLTAVMRAEPVIANEVLALQQRLQSAFAQPLPAKIAADERLDGRPEPVERR